MNVNAELALKFLMSVGIYLEKDLGRMEKGTQDTLRDPKVPLIIGSTPYVDQYLLQYMPNI